MKCGGCGKEEQHHRGERIETEIAPGLTMVVCTKRGHRYPSPSCVRKAREAAERCPGCGREGQAIGSICSECRAAIERGKTVQPVSWHVIDGVRMLPYSGDEARPDGKRLSQILARIAAGGGRQVARAYDLPSHHFSHQRHIPSYDGYYGEAAAAELTDDQAAAMRELGDVINSLMELQRRQGHKTGLSLLARLGSGDVTIEQFEDAKTRLLAAEVKRGNAR